MFSIDVTADVEKLIEILDTRVFADFDEHDNLIKDYCLNLEQKIRTEVIDKLQRIEKLKEANIKIESKVQFDNIMDEIDAIILERELYFEKIKKKYKYRGRYGNAKGKTRNGKNTSYNKSENYKQLCFMSKTGAPLFG